MNLPLFIAGRYLFAKKSHNVINIISAISAIGMAIGTAALIIILSVYNGFDDIVTMSLGDVEPDILVSPSKGKVFVPKGEMFDLAYDDPRILNMSGVLQDNVYLGYDGRNGVALCKGVDMVYEEESPLAERMQEGSFNLHKGDVPLAVVGSALAFNMGISPRFLSSIDIYYPDREKQFSVSNPSSSLNMRKVYPEGIFAINSEIDADLLIVPIEIMRDLMGYTEEVSAVEIRVLPGTSSKEIKKLIKDLQKAGGDEYKVSDRLHQNEALYKMMRYEKAAVYLILLFVIIIIAFNIFGSLSMLIIEKDEDIGTFLSMGASPSLIKKIFILEGWMISLLGMAAGVVIGVALAFIQQKFGLISMPGQFMVSSYPVHIKLTDVVLTAASITVIGYLIALLPVSKWLKTDREVRSA